MLNNLINKIRKFLNRSNIVKNFSIMLFGNGVASIFSFLNVILITKTVGLVGVGLLTIAQTYSNTFSQIFNSQTYFAVTKYVTSALEKKDHEGAKQYIKQGFLLDTCTSLLALIVGYFALSFVNRFFHWNNELMLYIRLYMITMVFNIVGTAQAIIRTFDKFKYLSNINIFVSFLRMVAYIFCFFLHKGVLYFVVTEIIVVMISNVLLIYYAFKILRKNNLTGVFACKIKFEKEFFMFNMYNNWVSTLDLPLGQLTTFFINKYLGIQEVGIYNIIQRLGSVFQKLTSPLSQVVYPELTKQIAKNDFQQAYKLSKKIFARFCLFGAAVIVLFTAFAFILNEKLMKILGMTIDYHSFYVLMVLYICYLMLSVSVIGLHELFIALGFVSLNIPILLFANAIYILLLFAFVRHTGLVGLFITLSVQIFLVVLPKTEIMRRKIPSLEREAGS